MAWTPALEVADVTKITQNLLTYIQTNQSIARTWAGSSSLQDYADIYNSAAGRVATRYPVLMVIDKRTVTPFESDTLELLFEIGLEQAIVGANPDLLTRDTEIYVRALESMLANIDAVSLTTGMSGYWDIQIQAIETQYEELRGETQYAQITTTRAIYAMRTNAYE